MIVINNSFIVIIVILLLLSLLSSSFKYNSINRYRGYQQQREQFHLFAAKKPTPPTPTPVTTTEDKSKYFVAIGVFVFAALFDKFVYHADPAHDDALYKSTQSVKIK